MSASALETLIWVLIYGGLIVLGLGIAVQRSDAAFGWGLVVAGGILALAGVLLIVVRSRMKRQDRP
jgi:formate hydrogenlyase subunit 3/multisubunit Na+/H+ antiporter MnhD subunit